LEGYGNSIYRFSEHVQQYKERKDLVKLKKITSTTVSYKKIKANITILQIWFNQNYKGQEGSK
jgi:hypothetical protein